MLVRRCSSIKCSKGKKSKSTHKTVSKSISSVLLFKLNNILKLFNLEYIYSLFAFLGMFIQRFVKGLKIIWALTGSNPIIELNQNMVEFKSDGRLKISGHILQTEHDIVLVNSSEQFTTEVLEACKEDRLSALIEQDYLLSSLDAEITARKD